MTAACNEVRFTEDRKILLSPLGENRKNTSNTFRKSLTLHHPGYIFYSFERESVVTVLKSLSSKPPSEYRGRFFSPRSFDRRQVLWQVCVQREVNSILRFSLDTQSCQACSKLFFYNGEFDPGSGRTLAACLTHASRGVTV